VRLLLPWLAARAVLDRPNERSSHRHPTPRGGGIAVVAVLIVALWAIHLANGAPWRMTVIMTAELGALALVSWIDDRRGASMFLRLAVQLAAVTAGLATIGLGPVAERLGISPWLLAVPFAFAWMWFVNLYNFMDGIDGITSVETASIGVGLVALAVVTLGAVAGQGLTGLALAGAAIGFLLWNWHPARIFLGDVGSVPLGYLLGFLLLWAAARGYWRIALILPLYFLADATITLFRRLVRGERVWRPHRSHFYQRAVQRGLGHAAVVRRMIAADIMLIGCGWAAENGAGDTALSLAFATVLALLFSLAGLPRRA